MLNTLQQFNLKHNYLPLMSLASTLEQQLLPKVEIKKALPERLKLPRELTRLSRVPSVLYPPLTLHQLMSAR
jgi:hypothetical protein